MMKAIYAGLIAQLFLMACGREDERSQLLAESIDGYYVCNKEDTRLYIAFRDTNSEGTETRVSGWQVVEPNNSCVRIDYDGYTALGYYIQSERGLYSPERTTYRSDVEEDVCLPTNSSFGTRFSFAYNTKRLAETGACPSGYSRYPIVGLRFSGEYLNANTLRFVSSFQGGTFDGTRTLSTTNSQPIKSYDEAVNELKDVKAQLDKVKKDYEECDREITRIVAIQDIFKVRLSELDGLSSICGYENADLETLKERIRTFRRQAFDGVNAIAIAMRNLYTSLLLKGKPLGINEPIKSAVDQLGLEQFTRPTVDSVKSSSDGGFFSDLVDRYKEVFARYYQQETRSFFVSAMAYLSTFSSFGEDYVKTEDIDEKSYLDYIRAVEIGEKYFETIDFDKDEYGYPLNSPVPNEVKKTIRDDIKPKAPSEAIALDSELKKWEGTLTEQQKAVLEAVRFLGKAFQATVIALPSEVASINQRLKSITEGAVMAAKEAITCAAKVGAAGDFADWYEIANKKDFCTGEEIAFAGQVITSAALFVGQGRFWRALGDILGVSTSVGKVATAAASVSDSAKVYGIKTPQGMKVFGKIAEAVETLPGKLKVQRIREGADASKVAIVGRSMGNAEQGLVGVRDAAAHLKSKGINANTFEPSTTALDKFQDAVKEYRQSVGNQTAMLPDDMVRATEMYKENMNWVRRLKEEGFTVIDIGNPNNLPDTSVFYEMEKGILF